MKCELRATKNMMSILTDIENKFGITPVGLVCLVIIGISPFIVGDEFTIRLLVSTLMFGALAMAFDFTTGYINICNFGYCAFWGLGAYTSAILAVRLGVSPWIGMLCGGVMSALLGFCLGLLTIRLGGIFASCMTWFVALTMMSVANNWVSLTKGSAGLNVPPLFDTVYNTPYFYVMFVIAMIVLFSLMYITKLNYGLAFRAIGQDIEAASSSGVNPVKYKIINFTISCAIAGLIGGFYAHYVGILTPLTMHTSKTVEIMAISYIGGRGTIWGSLLSAMIMIPLMEYAKDLMEFRLIIYGALMILVMILYPKGSVGICEKVLTIIKSRRVKNAKTVQE
jgi:branched-chain amino acid transport system permease protein